MVFSTFAAAKMLTGLVVTAAAGLANLPAAGTTGPLEVSARIALDISAPYFYPLAAEASDGAVFVAQASYGPSVVWVIDGDGPPAVAEHVPAVSALAVDSTDLYVASYTAVTAFSRSTGNRVGEWALPKFSSFSSSQADLVSMYAFDGGVLVSLPYGHGVIVGGDDLYQIASGSTAAPRLVGRATSAVPGDNGALYFVTPADHLAELSAAGATTVGPALVNGPSGKSDPAFVWSVAGGRVWVSDVVNNHFDMDYRTYNAQTLKLMGGPYQWGPWSPPQQVVTTSAGSLVLAAAGDVKCAKQPGTQPTYCASRISALGTLSDPTPVGSALLLLGPEPAVITTNRAHTSLQLDRLAAA